jgi:hypothetical protein
VREGRKHEVEQGVPQSRRGDIAGVPADARRRCVGEAAKGFAQPFDQHCANKGGGLPRRVLAPKQPRSATHGLWHDGIGLCHLIVGLIAFGALAVTIHEGAEGLGPF